MWSTVCDLITLEATEETETISQQSMAIDREPCKYCSNNPQNGGDGICFCILGTPTI